MTASTLAKNLQAGRLALVSGARPPVNPSDAVISGTLLFPFVGIAMQTAPRPLHGLVLVWTILTLSPLKEERELHGSPAGLVLPSNREH